MTASVFTVSRHDLYVGAALVCPDTRYFSVTISGVPTVYRRAIPPDAWSAICEEVAAGFGAAPLPNTSAIGRLICNHEPTAYRVLCVAQPMVKTGSAEQVAADLDRMLREVCAASGSTRVVRDRQQA